MRWNPACCFLLAIVARGPAMAGAAAAESGSTPVAPRVEAVSGAEPLPSIFTPRAAQPPVSTSTRPAPRPRLGSRAVSPETAARLQAAAPTFEPATPGAGTSNGTGTTTARPTNVLQLAPYIVRDGRMPTLREIDVLTPKGRLERMKQRHPGLGGGNNGVARGMLEDELAAMRRTEITDLEDFMASVDVELSRAMKRNMDEARVRNNEWSSQEGTPFRERR